jgi:F-type H+-transporting ATPase subunit delta
MDLSLHGYAATVVRALPEQERPAFADQVAQVVAAVEGTASLAAAMSDVTVPARARQAVLDDLLTGKVPPAVVRLVRYAVGVERAPELLGALAELAEVVRLRVERPEEAAELDERPYGRLALRRLLSGMVAAELDEVEDVAALEEIEDELFRFARTVADAPELRAVLSDWSVPADRRAGIVETLLAGKASAVTVRMAVAAARMRTRDMADLFDWLAERVAEARGWRVARVRAAMEVDDEERRRLGEAMARLAGRPVEVRVAIDPTLIGGAQVVIGDLLVDATTRHRLQQIEERLSGPEGAVRSLLGNDGVSGGGRA